MAVAKHAIVQPTLWLTFSVANVVTLFRFSLSVLVQSTFVDNSMTVENARDYGHIHLSEVRVVHVQPS